MGASAVRRISMGLVDYLLNLNGQPRFMADLDFDYSLDFLARSVRNEWG